MKIHFVSDLHLEFGDLTLPGGEVLILAGDICEAKNFKMNEYNPSGNFSTHRGRIDRYARFFQEECAKYRQVFYVMGNHEHYHGRWFDTYQVILDQLPDNVCLLEKQRHDFEDVVFIGGTLWTDCNRGDPVTVTSLKDMMNDYRVITYNDKAKNIYHKLDPKNTMKEHRTTLNKFRSLLADTKDKTVVMITHHAPSTLSINEMYKHDYYMNGGYASDISEFILDHPQIKFWIHGHVHLPVDYTIGNTRVLANPRGYEGFEATQFDINRFFEV